MSITKRLLVLCVAASLSLAACSPPPRHTLATDERTADLYWLFSQFGENYAPLQYKESRFGFKYDELKQEFLKRAEGLDANAPFYQLQQEFVAKFQDAHTSGMFLSPVLPGRAEVAYLGIRGVRSGENFVVTGLLPTFDPKTFPIKKGMKIVKFNGKTIRQAVATEILPYRNLGQDESNFSFLSRSLFGRSSIVMPIPTATDVILTVKEGANEFEVQLPWIKKDLLTFSKEQESAASKKAEELSRIERSNLEISALAVDGKFNLMDLWLKSMTRFTDQFKVWETFRFIDTAPVLDSKIYASSLKNILKQLGTEEARKILEIAGTPLDQLKEDRNVPADAIFLSVAKTYPAYITTVAVKGTPAPTPSPSATPTEISVETPAAAGRSVNIGYIRLDTFSPAEGEDVVLKEFVATLKQMKTLGVKDIVIDMLDNGGGSLTLGLKLGQALSKSKLVYPEIQFRTSETWIDEFENASRTGSDYSRELARRIFVALDEDAKAGNRLSRRFSTELFFGGAVQPNRDIETPFNIVLLVNEGCASMCDIFTAMLKDNTMARVVGSQTMGAGGNVVTHFQSPNSHFIVNQTESLILRRDGTYIENNGVQPDVAIAVHESATNKYQAVLDKGLSSLADAYANTTEAQ